MGGGENGGTVTHMLGCVALKYRPTFFREMWFIYCSCMVVHVNLGNIP